MRWEIKHLFDGQLYQKYFYQKLLKSDNSSLSYNQKCPGCFFPDTVYITVGYAPLDLVNVYTRDVSYCCYRTGMPTPHCNEGTQTRKTLRWIEETENWKTSALTSRLEDDWRERTQWQLGKTRDPSVGY